MVDNTRLVEFNPDVRSHLVDTGCEHRGGGFRVLSVVTDVHDRARDLIVVLYLKNS